MSSVGRLQFVQAIAGMVSVLATVALATAAHAARNLPGPAALDLVQGLRLGQLAPGCVCWTLVVPVVSVPNVGEVMYLMRLRKHINSKRMDSGISPLQNCMLAKQPTR